MVVNLSSIMDFKQPPKDGHVLELDLMNGTELLRFKTDADLDFWRRSLLEWKDFHRDYGILYDSSKAELASNPVVVAPRASFTSKESEMTGGPRKSFFSLGGGGAKKEEAGPVSSVQKDRSDLDNMQLDEEDDEEKGVRPLIKVQPSPPRSSLC